MLEFDTGERRSTYCKEEIQQFYENINNKVSYYNVNSHSKF